MVQIRDGKLASETVRRRPGAKSPSPSPQGASQHEGGASNDDSWEDHFEELIVLDSAGRLQIPKQYREELGFENRVEMEVTEGGILIRPAQNLEQTSSQAEIQIEREIRDEESGAPTGLLARLTRRE